MTTTTTMSAMQQLEHAERIRRGYPTAMLRASSVPVLQGIGHVLEIPETDSYISQYGLYRLINTFIDRQVGLAHYRIQQEKKYVTQPIATPHDIPVFSTHLMPESELDTLCKRLQSVSGKHEDAYKHIASLIERETMVARASMHSGGVVTHVILSLRLYACVCLSQQLRSCIARVCDLLEGK